MRTSLVLAVILAGACGASPKHAEPAAAPAPPQTAHRDGLRIKLTTIYVDDLDKALRFYTDVLGFAKKDDVTNGGYRWLTVSSPGDADGSALQLAPSADPSAKAYQQALFQQNRPATMFYTSDLKRDYERIKAKGAEFTMPPTDITYATIAMLKDTCGNLIQLTQLQ